ncbi:RNA polymerase sigma factor [Knoellia sinensis KCTC 19936]|uniref:RNA polymerase sigma factor n=1 Tax=Knoellia sinensis KCTC 19936 TaxID=1385520 RepID=A0A0A0JB17_9MICO|nr:SigE family RNA polymerase sigma factor [Knoellia sinensis]KGN34348.1 RNA polymerase sigma factor [Knoellia sinensis KCTC 19936]
MDRDDEAAFAEFVTREWSRLVRVGYLLTGDVGRAEDLVQQALVKVHRHWSRVHRDGAPYAYTRAAIANESTSWWRRRRVAEDLGDVPAHADRSTRDAYAGVDNRDELIRALHTLPPRMRAVVVLRYYDELSEAETAQALGMSVGSVKSQTSRGLDRLRSVISESAAPSSSLQTNGA